MTRLMESKGKDSNLMNSHNNRIGTQIGTHSIAIRCSGATMGIEISSDRSKLRALDCSRDHVDSPISIKSTRGLTLP